MKKSLLGTTALVAAAVAVSGVQADEMMAEPISVSVGGNAHWGVAIVDSDSSMDDDLVISNDVELNFTGSTVLDSGLEVGMRIEIEGEQHDDQGDRTYAFVSGSFGELRIGNDSDMSEKVATAAPYATYFYGLNSPFWAGSFSSSISTFAGAGFSDGASILYFSPVINGFQFGVSYTPESGEEARSGSAANPEGGEVISVGARYDGSFGDAGIAISAGFASMDVPGTAATEDSLAVINGELLDEQEMTIATEYQTYLDAVATDPEQTSVTNPFDDDGMYVGTGVNADEIPGNIVMGMEGMPAVPGSTVDDMAVGVSVSMSGVAVGGSYRVVDNESPGQHGHV